MIVSHTRMLFFTYFYIYNCYICAKVVTEKKHLKRWDHVVTVALKNAKEHGG